LDEVINRIRSIKKILLPGPIEIPDELLKYASLKPINHRSSDFIELLSKVMGYLRTVLGIDNEDHLIMIPGSSTIGLEAVFSNIVSRDTRVLVLEYGFFGYRIREIVSRYTDKVDTITYKYPEIPCRDDILGVLEDHDYDVVSIVHNETSIGYVIRFLQDIVRIVHGKDAYLVVDGVSSIGVEPFMLSRWGVDAVVTGSQKALSGLPGLSIVGFTRRFYDRVMELRRQGHKVPFYIDIPMYVEEYGRYGWIPTTPPINSLYVLYAGLRKIMDIGLDNYLELHRRRAVEVYKYAMDHGLEPVIKDPYYRSHAVAVFHMENSIRIVERIRREHGVLLAFGVGEYRDKMIRIGMMGFIDTRDIIEAIDLVLEYSRQTS